MIDDPQRALADAIEGRAKDLALRCTEAMYLDPFWQARFGDRGRRHADEDSVYHTRYLVTALRAGSPPIFRQYALWLRSVLTARGMCTLHLTLDFGHLIAGLRAWIDQPDVAIAVIDDGARALVYTTGSAGQLDAHTPAIEARVEAALGRGGYRLRELLSFLADALHRQDPKSVAAHLAFLRTTLTHDDAERVHLDQTLEALVHAASQESSFELVGALRTLLVHPV